MIKSVDTGTLSMEVTQNRHVNQWNSREDKETIPETIYPPDLRQRGQN